MSGLLRHRFAKGGIHIILLDACLQIAALAQILLFGAIAHHPGVSNARLLFGALRRRFICHVKYSVRGCACLNAANDVWFRADR